MIFGLIFKTRTTIAEVVGDDEQSGAGNVGTDACEREGAQCRQHPCMMAISASVRFRDGGKQESLS